MDVLQGTPVVVFLLTSNRPTYSRISVPKCDRKTVEPGNDSFFAQRLYGWKHSNSYHFGRRELIDGLMEQIRKSLQEIFRSMLYKWATQKEYHALGVNRSQSFRPATDICTSSHTSFYNQSDKSLSLKRCTIMR